MSSVEFTSEAVRAARFREKLKGYHPEDVDAFLERTATAIDQLSARLGEATARAMKAETALAENSEADESVRKTLVLAQRTAEMAVNEAKEEARQLREAAAAAADQLRASATAEAESIRVAAAAEAESVRAAALAEAETWKAEAERTRAEAIEAAEATRSEVNEHIRALDEEAQAAREQLLSDAVKESEETVRALAEKEAGLRAAVADLAGYLAAERERVLGVLHDAVEHFGRGLTPAVRPDSELAGGIDREELAKTSPDPASEDSWKFDPAVLEQPENQWWSEPADPAAATSEPEAEPTTDVASQPTTATTDPAAEAPEATADPAAATAEPHDSAEPEPVSGAIDEPVTDAPADGSWAAPIASNEPLPDWFTAAVPGVTDAAAHSEDTRQVQSDVAAVPAADPEPVAESDAPEPADHDGARAADDDEPPSLLLFTLEDDGRHESDELPYSASGKARRSLGVATTEGVAQYEGLSRR